MDDLKKKFENVLKRAEKIISTKNLSHSNILQKKKNLVKEKKKIRKRIKRKKKIKSFF